MAEIYDPIPNEKTLLSWMEVDPDDPDTPPEPDDEAWAEIGSLQTVQAPGGEVESVESAVKQTDRRYRANQIRKLGQLKFGVEFTPNEAGHTDLVELFDVPDDVWWKIEYPDGFDLPATDIFKGFVTDFAPKTQGTSGNLEADFTVQASDDTQTTPGANE